MDKSITGGMSLTCIVLLDNRLFSISLSSSVKESRLDEGERLNDAM